MMSIIFKNDEKTLIDLQAKFNELSELHYPDMLEWNHYDFWQKSNKYFNPIDWKTFRLDRRVNEWYEQELMLIAQQKAFKLFRKAGDNKSVGEAQALTQTMSFLKDGKPKRNKQTKIVYCFVNLSQNEEAAKNVKVIENIPIEIENALTRYNRNKQS